MAKLALRHMFSEQQLAFNCFSSCLRVDGRSRLPCLCGVVVFPPQRRRQPKAADDVPVLTSLALSYGLHFVYFHDTVTHFPARYSVATLGC